MHKLNLSLHKELYFFEWERKERLERSATLPSALISALVGSMLFLLIGFPYNDNILTILFVSAASASAVSLIAGVYFLVNSLFGYWYEQIPSSDKLQKYFEELQNYHNSSDNSAEMAQQDFDEYLQARLAEATATNRSNNIHTGGAIHKSIGSIILAVVFASIAVVPYLVESIPTTNDKTAVCLETLT